MEIKCQVEGCDSNLEFLVIYFGSQRMFGLPLSEGMSFNWVGIDRDSEYDYLVDCANGHHTRLADFTQEMRDRFGALEDDEPIKIPDMD